MNNTDSMEPQGETYTYMELEAAVAEQWANMCDDERYARISTVDPTFEQYVLSCMKLGQIAFINNLHKEYTIHN